MDDYTKIGVGLLVTTLTVGTAMSMAAARQSDAQQKEHQLYAQKINGQGISKTRLANIISWQDTGTLKIMAARNILPVLSAEGLSADVVVQILNSEVHINPNLDAKTQSLALTLATHYIDGQARDQIAYGYGENFTLGDGRLVNRGKFSAEREKLLVPTAAP